MNSTLRLPVGRPALSAVLLWLALIPLLVFVGLIAAVIPAHFVVALLALPLIMMLTLGYPLIAVVLAIFVTFGAIPSAFLPQLPLAGGTVRASELFLAGVACMLALHMVATRGVHLHRLQSEYTKPMLFFALLVVISSAVSLGYFRTPLKFYLYELRVCLYWFVFPLVLYAVRDARTLRNFIISMTCIGLVIGVGVIIQFATGIQVLEAAAVQNLQTVGQNFSDVRRSFAGGGIYFVLFALNLGLALWAYKRLHIVVAAVLCGLSAFALLVTFGRGVWAAEVVAVTLLIIAARGAARIRLILALGIALTLAVSALFAFAPNVLEAAYSRATSVGAEVNSGESFAWRRAENSYAVEKIIANPAIGVGLGGAYQPARNQFMPIDQVRVIHNGYLYLALKFGVLAWLFPLWLAFISVRKFLRLRRNRQLDERGEAVLLTVMVTVFVPFMTSATQFEWMYHTGVAFFSFSFAALTLIERHLAVRRVEPVPSHG